MDSTLWWIVGIVVVVAVIAAIVWAGSKNRRLEAQRGKAEEIRNEAREHEHDLREHEGRAEEMQARAEQARAEADRNVAEAKRLQAEADRRGEGVSEIRDERDARLRAADARDPDVRTDADGYRVDEEGERLTGEESPRADYRRE
jgi:peptidoglycan hydrolase CwlO-like protein